MGQLTKIPTGYICITVEDYAGLIRSDERLEMLCNALDGLFETANLTWNAEKLRFDADDIEPILKRFMGNTYIKTLNKLKREQEEREKSND